MTNWKVITFEYVCPSIGILISTALYSAPVNSLGVALERGSLGPLNSTPWGVMTGNCVGWLAYSYYSRDPFVLASNIPGIIVSFWLNSGASKLQYYANAKSGGGNDEVSIRTEKSFLFTYQDKLMLGVLILWMSILVCVDWLTITNGFEKEIIGIFVNINLLFFYGAPLQSMKTVIVEKRSDTIHTPTMILNCTNAGFWAAYGIAIDNPVIYGPNGIGIFLGLSQAALCCMYPKHSPQRYSGNVDYTPLLSSSDDSGREVEEATSAVDSHEIT